METYFIVDLFCIAIVNIVSTQVYGMLGMLSLMLLVIVGYMLKYDFVRRTQLLRAIEVDEVTGLMTEQKFVKECEKRVRNTYGQYMLISIDIDNFKYINEFYGFQTGSDILASFASGLQDSYGTDSLCARLFGDRFAILTTTKDESCTFCGKLSCARCELPNVTSILGENYNLNISAGAYHILDPTVEFAHMLDCANIARLESKEVYGIKTTLYSDVMDKNIHIRYEIIRTMQQAIIDREFKVVYQPKVNLVTGEVCGCEALVRWIKKDGTMVFPDHFIPIFEKNGFIVNLDYYMVEEVCKFISECSEIKLPKTSINLSGFTLLQDDLVESIVNIVERYNVSLDILELEITESAIVDNFHIAVLKIQELIQYGFTISMDDFGAGVSSLNRLKDIQVHILKIDREFLNDTLEDKKGVVIMSNVIHMAHQLGILTIAEGVENKEHLNLLGELGCDMGQGYYFSKPLFEDDYCSYLEHYNGEGNCVKVEKPLDVDMLRRKGLESVASLVMDSTDCIMYISDFITDEVCFVSEETKKIFGLTEESHWKGKKYYELFQGMGETSEFTKMHELNEEHFNKWEHYNELTNNYYMIHERLITLEDRRMRLEIARDITEQRVVESDTVYKLREQQVLNECIELLQHSNSNVNTSESIDKLLHIIGDYYEAERGYIFLLTADGKFLNNAYEWCRENIEPQIDVLQGIDRTIVDHWFEKYDHQGEFYIDSIHEEVDRNSQEFKILDSQGIVSLVTAPLRNEEGKYTGFIGVDNPNAYITNTKLLRSVTTFVDVFFEHNVLIQELNRLSYIDGLTEMKNRHSYENTLKKIMKQKVRTMGVAYYDINFLKEINDTHGHEGGDRAITSCANLIKQVFHNEGYRIGGDEFVILCPEMLEEEFTAKIEELKSLSLSNEIAQASIGYVWSNQVYDVMKLVQEADRLMYSEKENFHTTKKNDR